MSKAKINKISMTTLSLLFFLLSGSAFSAVHFSLQGSSSTSDVGLQSYNKNAISMSVAFDLGSHFRLGLTHREENNTQEGYVLNTADSAYYLKNQKMLITSNSIDLTLIIYYGKIVVPFIQGGAIIKDYAVTDTIAGLSSSSSIQSPPVPNAGIGTNIVLNRNFSLKLSYNVSPGYKIADPTDQDQIEAVWDSYTSIGVTYKL